MKQTNNAIKFLLAQYRSIFNRAYLKGLASAAILTSALVAGATANATATSFDPASGAFSGPIVITGADSFTMDGKEYTLTGSKGVSFSQDSGGNWGVSFGSGGATFKLNNASFNVESDDHAGYGARVSFGQGTYNLEGTNTVSQQLTIDGGDSGNITISGGSLIINGLLTISKNKSGTISMAGTNVTINPGPVSTDGETSEGGLIIDQNITVGDITFNKDAYILLYRDDNWGTSGASDDGFSSEKTITIAEDKTITFNGQQSLLSSDSREQIEKTRFSLTLSGSGSGANAIIAKNASFTSERDLKLKAIDLQNSGTFNNNATFTVDDNSSYTNAGVFNNENGAEILISGSTAATFTNDKNGVLNNNGTITVSGSESSLIISSGSTYNGSTGELSLNSGNLSFDVSVVDDIKDLGTFDNASGSITITDTSKSDKTFTIHGQKDLNNLLDGGESFEGTVVLSGSTLYSDEKLDLSKAIMAQFDGSTNGIIHADTINYTVDASNEDNKGVTVFGDTLTFNSNVNNVILSGSTAPQKFQAYNLGTSGGKDLIVSGNIYIDMVSDSATLATGSINTDLTLSGGSTGTAALNIQDLSVTADNIKIGQSGSLSLTGKNFDTTKLNIEGALTLSQDSTNAPSVKVSNATLQANQVDAGSGAITVNNGTLIVAGDSSGDTLDLTSGSQITVTNGTLDLSKGSDTVQLNLADDGKWTTAADYEKVNFSGSTVKVDLSGIANNNKITIEQANSLLGTLVSGSGLVDFGTTATVDLNIQDGKVSAGSIASGDNVIVNFETEETKAAVVTDLKGTITGGWAGVTTDGTTNPVKVAENGQLSLYGTASGDNIVADSSGNVVGLTMANGATVKLETTGNIGAITGGTGTLNLADGSNINVVSVSSNDSKDDVTVDTITGTGTLSAQNVTTNSLEGSATINATGDIKTKNAELTGATISGANFTVQAEAGNSFSLTSTALNVTNNIDLTKVSGTASLTSSSISGQKINVDDAAFTSGSVVSGSTLSGTTVTASDSTLTITDKATVNSLTLDQNAAAYVDTLSTSKFIVGSDENQANGTTASSAKAQIQTLDLKNGLMQIDPAYGQDTALVTVDKFSTTINDGDPETDVGVANGDIFVGRNSALGLGVKSLAELQQIIAKYQSGNSLQEDGYGAIVYVDGHLNIDSGHGITLTNKGVNAFTAPTFANENKVVGDAIYFGDNTALIVNSENFSDTEAFITFAGTNGKLYAAGGEIVVNGDVKSGDIKLFGSANGTVSVVDGQGQSNQNASITVTTENNLLVGQLTDANSGTVSLSVDLDKAGNILNAASTPVFNTIIAYGRGYNGDAASLNEAKDEDKLFGSYKTDGSPDYDKKYNNYFLQQELTKGNGSSTEKVARLGVYGGATQAALVAGESTYEAVAGRMGVGAQTGNITFADNGQGAGLWVTPIYKNQDSDGFAAQGLSYGADLDLYGVALGGDFTLANGLRVGAAFNVGSGDADGQGAGAGVSNDFDYYGFAVYGGFTYDKLSIVGDVSYTVVDNDVEANTQFDKVSASMDTSDLSVGVTAQYGLNYNGLDITPHVGLRYSYIDMDDYTVKGSEDIAKYDGDSLSVFSIPVGVTFAKDFTAGDWTIKPALDLTLTANMGDDSIDGNVSWANVNNLNTKLESEVLDDWTYGATLGVAAKSGNLSFGLGVNYTGASNADSYGVSANARFVF